MSGVERFTRDPETIRIDRELSDVYHQYAIGKIDVAGLQHGISAVRAAAAWRRDVDKRRISHELVLAWQDVEMEYGVESERMVNALDAIIAAYTPGYNAEEPPETDESEEPWWHEVERKAYGDSPVSRLTPEQR
jgi:hypothetical protein